MLVGFDADVVLVLDRVADVGGAVAACALQFLLYSLESTEVHMIPSAVHHLDPSPPNNVGNT